LDDDTPQVAESASHAATVEHEFRFPKRLLNQLIKSAKRAEQRRRQSAAFLRLESRVSFSAEPATRAEVDLVSGNIPYSSSATNPVSVSQHHALVDASFSPPAVDSLCQCCRLSLEAGGMSSANEFVFTVPVQEALNHHSVSRSLSAFVSHQLVKLQSFEEATCVAMRNGTAVLLQKIPW
jgi:hypothetical protein